MNFTIILFIFSKTWFVGPPCPFCPDSEKVTLRETIDKAKTGDIIFIKPGRYEATPTPYLEKICGNCAEPLTEVKELMTRLVVTGIFLRIHFSQETIHLSSLQIHPARMQAIHCLLTGMVATLIWVYTVVP